MFVMDRKNKILFASISLNIILIFLLVVGYARVDIAHKQLFMMEVQQNFIELEGLIAHQIKNDWSEPNLVTNKLGDVINGIFVAIKTSEHSGWISKNNKRLLNDLHLRLNRYPNNELYQFADLKQSDKEHFEEFRIKLREVGWGMGITTSDDWKGFINKSRKLVELLD